LVISLAPSLARSYTASLTYIADFNTALSPCRAVARSLLFSIPHRDAKRAHLETHFSPNRKMPMARADDAAQELRDQAVRVVLARGAITVATPEQRTFTDARLRIEFWPGSPCAIDIYKASDHETKVFGQIWNPDGDAVTVVHQHGSWEDILARVAKACV
jgi:hypothetical protein